MVARILKIFHKEFHNVNEAAILIGFFTLLSQFLGLLRDRLFVGELGAGLQLDIYYAAFKVPDILFALIASLVSVTILIPFFIGKLKSKEDKYKKAHVFMNQVFSAFSILIIVVSVIVGIFMPELIAIIAPGFSESAQISTVLLSRIMLLSPILLGLSNLFATITQSFKKFFVYALSPVFYNLGLIAGIILLYPIFGTVGLAYGVVLGAFLHLAIQLPTIIKQGMLPWPTLKINFKEMFKIVKISLPRTFTLALSNLVFVVLLAFASKMGEGSISIFTLARNLQNVPLALIGVSFSVAAFPLLVDYLHQEKVKEFVSHIINPMKQIIFWSIPMVVLFVVLRAQIIRVILGTGEFTWHDTRLVAATLTIFIVSVVMQSLILLLVKGYYAAGETYKPLLVTFLSSVLSVFFALGFVEVFNEIELVRYFFESMLRITDLQGSSVIMLALGYSIGAFLNFFALWFWFKKDFPYTAYIQKGLKHTLFQSVGSSLIMGGVAYFGLNIFANTFDLDTFVGIFMQGFLAGIIGIIAWIIVLKLLKSKELREIWEVFSSKLWRGRKVITPEQSEL